MHLTRVLVFTRAAGYRHESTPAGVRALAEIGAAEGFRTDATEDPAIFTAEGLAPFAAVVFLNTSGTVLDPDQRLALMDFLRAGRGFVGVHGAANTEYDWPWYGELLGAWFDRHPPDVQPGTMTVEDRTHPATAHLGPRWTFVEEWYDFTTNPRAGSHVLISVEEDSYRGGTMGGDHPITWCRSHDGARVFYTGLGHSAEAYADEAFRRVLAGGIRWASG